MRGFVQGLAAAGMALAAVAGGPTPATAQVDLEVATVAEGLEHPWGMAFLPDGRMLVTERPGRLRLVSAGGLVSEPIVGLPEIRARGQGGLMDVVLAPDFAETREIFISFSEPGPGGAATAVARGQLADGFLENVEIVFRQHPRVENPRHWGSRLVFAEDGTLFVTLGDRGDFSDQAQDLSDLIGTVARVHRDGGIPADNPFVEEANADPAIWSYGHRNIQGAALHPETGALWTHEHGARGGDEVNIASPGLNYGWPVITHGVDYSGASIGIGSAAPGMEQPLHYWVPSIAPSGMAFVTGDVYPGWQGDLLVGALRDRLLVRLELEGDVVVAEHRLLRDLGERIRDVRIGPDGHIYLLTDSPDGRVLRVDPASS